MRVATQVVRIGGRGHRLAGAGIRTRATRLTPVRVRFDYDVIGPGGDLLAQGRTVHAAITPDGRPRRLPASVSALFDAASAG